MALSVRNWAEHQHYKDRSPLWIKVYGALLDDVAFLALPEPAQAQLVKLWLLASRRGNIIPDTPAMLRGLIGVKGKLYTDLLIAGNWLEEVEDPASKTLAETADPASKMLAENPDSASETLAPLARARVERERERETTPPPAREKLANPWWSDPRVVGFFEHLTPREATGWTARLRLWLEGEDWPGRKPSPDEIASGLNAAMTAKRDGALGDKWVRGCIRRSMAGEAAAPDIAPVDPENPSNDPFLAGALMVQRAARGAP